MTYKEFKAQVRAVEAKVFRSTETHPISFAVERAAFEEEKLNQLIALAKRASFMTAKNRLAAWRRQLERVRAKKERLTQFNVSIAAKPYNSTRAAEPQILSTR